MVVRQNLKLSKRLKSKMDENDTGLKMIEIHTPGPFMINGKAQSYVDNDF